MGRINERTLQMIRYYKKHWKDPDCTPTEVAKKFKLSVQTVYSYLQLIADELSNELHYPVAREELLDKPHSEHLCYERKFEKVELIDLEKFRRHYTETKESMHKTVEAIDAMLIAQDIEGMNNGKGDL